MTSQLRGKFKNRKIKKINDGMFLNVNTRWQQCLYLSIMMDRQFYPSVNRGDNSKLSSTGIKPANTNTLHETAEFGDCYHRAVISKTLPQLKKALVHT